MNAHPTPEQLSARLDGELKAAEAASVDVHVRGCAQCAGWLAETKALEGLVDEALPVPPASYFETFGERLRPRLAARPARSVLTRPWVAAVAAALVVGVLVPVLVRQGAVGERTAQAPAAPATASPDIAAGVVPEAPGPGPRPP